MLALLSVAVGCSHAGTQAPATATFPTGMFTNGGWTWEFKAGGSFISSGPPGSETGTYIVSGNQVVITCQCCGDIPGTYAWSYSSDALVFKAIEDKCSNRLGVVAAGSWLKNP